jgi:hypothetical protein
MKRYAILTVVVLAVLVVAWTAFGQGEEGGERRQQRRESSERFQEAKQIFENMSQEERDEFRARMRERFEKQYVEERQKSIKAIEEQLAKLKASQKPQPEARYQDMSQDELTEFLKKSRAVGQENQKALQAIIVQVAKLQGRSKLEGEGDKFLIISNNNLKSIKETATKEKAKETSELLERLISKGGDKGFERWRQKKSRPQSDQ